MTSHCSAQVTVDGYLILSPTRRWHVYLIMGLTSAMTSRNDVTLMTSTCSVQVSVDRSLTLYPTCRWRVYFIMGLFTTLNGVCIVFASPPSRTAPYLQGVLSTMIIPFTVLCRLLILRKGACAYKCITDMWLYSQT